MADSGETDSLPTVWFALHSAASWLLYFGCHTAVTEKVVDVEAVLGFPVKAVEAVVGTDFRLRALCGWLRNEACFDLAFGRFPPLGRSLKPPGRQLNGRTALLVSVQPCFCRNDFPWGHSEG